MSRMIPAIRFRGFTDEWEQRKVGEITSVSSGSRVHKDDWTANGVPFYRSSDVVSAYKGTQNEKAFISQELFESLAAISGKLEKEDILITGGGSIGIPYIVPDNKPLYTKDADLIWVKKSTNHDSKYLYTYFESKSFREYLSSISHTGTISHYTIEQVKATPVSMPVLEEQKKIGEFFADMDRLISLHQRKCDALKELKKGMLQKMFPKNGAKVPEFRFKGFTDDWEQRKLGEITGRTYGGGTPKTDVDEYWEGNIPWIQSSNLTEHQLFDVDIQKHVTEKGLQKSATQLVPANSIAVVSHVGVGKLVYMPFQYTTSQDFISLAELKTEPKFTSYAIYKRLQKDMHIVQGSAIKGITKDDLLNKEISVPVYEEQEAIGKYFSNLDNLITLYQHKCDELKKLKKGLLQKMFI